MSFVADTRSVWTARSSPVLAHVTSDVEGAGETSRGCRTFRVQFFVGQERQR